MSDDTGELSLDRTRLGWWLFVALLAIVAAAIAAEFIGILVLGIFGYYATRPINHRVTAVIDSDDVAAWTTVLVVLLPLLLLVAYAGIQLVLQIQSALGGTSFLPQELLETLPDAQRETLQSLLQNPLQFVSNPQQLIDVVSTVQAAASAFFGMLLLVSLAITLTYFLLANDDTLADGYRRLVGGEETTAYAYAVALDQDFASVWFGNFLFVLVMAVIATVAYWVTNLLAPPGLQIPLVFALGFFTGVASLIPLVVGKIVYLPVVGMLALQASRADGSPYLFVAGTLVVYFFVLDFLPQTFIQPYVTGRQLDTVMMMFGYLLGPILFGWYGLFLLPMIFIVILEAVRIVVPNLVRGEPLTTAVEMGDAVGTTPRTAESAIPEDDGTGSEGASESQDGPSDVGDDSIDSSEDTAGSTDDPASDQR